MTTPDQTVAKRRMYAEVDKDIKELQSSYMDAEGFTIMRRSEYLYVVKTKLMQETTRRVSEGNSNVKIPKGDLEKISVFRVYRDDMAVVKLRCFLAGYRTGQKSIGI